MKKGIILTIVAYFLWGLLPFYWKLLSAVPAYEILCHRMVWSLVFTSLILTIRHQWNWLQQVRQNPKHLISFFISAAFLSVNWFVFIWAVNSGFILDSSLGYFINPLISVLMGVIILKEKLRQGQTLAVLIAAIGVAYLTLEYGKFPWIALTLAFTFATYGLLRKTAKLNSVEGLNAESMFMALPAISFILYFGISGNGAFIQSGWSNSLLLIFSGAATAIPLILFAGGVRRIPLSMVGFIQYITPTLHFLIGYLVYHEPLTKPRLIGFIIIWIALMVYTVEGFVKNITVNRPVSRK